MDVATDPHVELPEAVMDECVEAIQEEGPMIPYLPSGIMTDIVLRLPAECIIQLWERNDLLYHLTTTPYFKRAHLARATPDIVVQFLSKQDDSDIDLLFFDGAGENVVISFAVDEYCGGSDNLRRSFDGFRLWSSCDGFLIFRGICNPTPLMCIFNPITEEQVTVTSPHKRFYVCGFYFHKRKKEYEVIFVRKFKLDGERMWEFQILILRTKLKRIVGISSYPPSKRRPALINGTFYWMVDGLYSEKRGPSDAILSFNIETEELRTIEVVMPSSDKNYAEFSQKLFELDGDLCLFDPFSSIIWVFNYTSKRWDKNHSISMPSMDYEDIWEFLTYFSDVEYNQMKGEFVAYDPWVKEKPLYIYNIRLGTWKMLDKKGFEENRCEATIYTPSLVSVSLDAADSVISL